MFFLHLWFKSSHCRATELHVAIAPPTVHAVGDTVRSRAVAGIWLATCGPIQCSLTRHHMTKTNVNLVSILVCDVWRASVQYVDVMAVLKRV